MLHGDANAFFNKKRGGPIIDVGQDLKLNFCLTTAAPPFTLSPDQAVRPLTMTETLQKIEEFKSMIAGQSRLRLVLNRNDLKKAILDGKIGVVLGLQNTPSGVNPQTLFDAGIRVMALAYYEENDIGSGFLNGGIKLKKFGEKVIVKCADIGMIIDFSHVGHQTALDSLFFIKTEGLSCRVMASHSGCVSRYHHMRNILDKTMTGIVNLGGVVGITTITFNLAEFNPKKKKSEVCNFLNHLEYAVKICGPNSIVIGSDAIYGNRTKEEGEEEMKKLAPRADPLDLQGIRFPENIYEGAGLLKKINEDLEISIYPHVQPALHDIDPKFIEGIMGKNLFNFFEQALPA